MVCIYCDSATQVVNSRLQKRSNQVWRRRFCPTCGNTFTTHELVDWGSSVVVRYSKRTLKPFSRDTLFTSIYESCKHRGDTAVSDANALTQTIMGQLKAHLSEGTLERDVIATVTVATLERYDQAAATMYGAYHPVSR